MPTQHPWTIQQLARHDAATARLNLAFNKLTAAQWDQPIRTGWTAKQMLAHLAFWAETTQPVVTSMLRGGDPLPEDHWYGGDNLGLNPDDPWPDADTHNARETAWANQHPTAHVISRCRQAHHQMRDLIQSVTPDEAAGQIGDYLTDAIAHVEHHLADLEALA
ncbi:MAG: maleylpyruvate isomerase N-terminal domain-containing protein [Planctomycetota bacterium]